MTLLPSTVRLADCDAGRGKFNFIILLTGHNSNNLLHLQNLGSNINTDSTKRTQQWIVLMRWNSKYCHYLAAWKLINRFSYAISVL